MGEAIFVIPRYAQTGSEGNSMNNMIPQGSKQSNPCVETSLQEQQETGTASGTPINSSGKEIIVRQTTFTLLAPKKWLKEKVLPSNFISTSCDQPTIPIRLKVGDWLWWIHRGILSEVSPDVAILHYFRQYSENIEIIYAHIM